MDFGTLSKSSAANMKRKQSSSLLAALGKPGQRSGGGFSSPPSAYNSTLGSGYAPSIASSDDSTTSAGMTSFYAPDTISRSSGRSISASSSSTMNAIYRSSGGSSGPRQLRRVEDVYHLVRDRLVAWSYLMQFYNSDLPWLNCVHVPRTALESALGTTRLDTLARQEYALGLSLAALFDISNIVDFLKAIDKLLSEWESWVEAGGNKGTVVGPLRNLFRPQRAKPRPTATTNTATAEVTIAPVDAQSESFLVLAVMPFTPDYFQVHASTCSIVRDVYKKLLAMVLPATRGGRSVMLGADTLLHASTLVLLGPNDGKGPASDIVSDAALLGSTEMSPNLTLVGEGQKLTSNATDLLQRVDVRLKKHYTSLLAIGDTLARRVLDEQLALATTSLATGPALQYAPPAPSTWTEAI